jgi:hypothetical protein
MKLVQMANEAGGKDNITVQLVEFVISIKKEEKQNKGLHKKIFLTTGLSVIVILAVLLTAYFIFFKEDKINKGSTNKIQQIDSAAQDDIILPLVPAAPESTPGVQPQVPPTQPAQTPMQKPPVQVPVPPIQVSPSPMPQIPAQPTQESNSPTVENPQSEGSQVEIEANPTGNAPGVEQ